MNAAGPEPCPLCGGSAGTEIRSFPAGLLEAEWKRAYAIDIRDEMDGAPLLRLLHCPRCSLGYFRPACVEGSPRLYEALGRLAWYHEAFRWEHRVALSDLPRGSRVLEIGCSTGAFLARARALRAAAVEGLETEPQAAAAACRAGLAVRVQDCREAAGADPAGYDAVCAFQVLEHVSQPAGFLRDCATLLRPGGTLILAVPNGRSYLRRQFNLLDMPPHHMTRWSARTMARLQELYPLRLRRILFEPLSEAHVRDFVETECSPLPRTARALLRLLLKGTGLRRLLRGHALYAAFTRLNGEMGR